MQLIDTHVHLTMPDYDTKAAGGLVGVLKRAQDGGVLQYVCPGLDRATSKAALALSETYESILPAVGLHPLSPNEDWERFRELATHSKVRAIGEIGTDAKAGDWQNQEARLRFFLELSIAVNKPALLHIRDTWDQTFAVLKDYPELRGNAVTHCFTGGMKEAEKAQELGILLSFTAIIARNQMEQTREVIKIWPLDQMMLETDGPWLAWPGESWPNEPVTVAKIAQTIAEIKTISIDEVADKTTQTARRFFHI